jgi:hypothetical protein
MVDVGNITDEQLHWGALQANSGTPNHADEALHIAHLHYDLGIPQKIIANRLGKGFSTGTVNGRLRLYNKLIKPIFTMLQKGEIKSSAAYEATKLSKEKQQELLTSLKEGEKLTQICAIEFYRKVQANHAKMFKDEEDEIELDVTGIFIPPNSMKDLMNGEIVEVEFNGDLIKFQKVEDFESKDVEDDAFVKGTKIP